MLKVKMQELLSKSRKSNLVESKVISGGSTIVSDPKSGL